MKNEKNVLVSIGILLLIVLFICSAIFNIRVEVTDRLVEYPPLSKAILQKDYETFKKICKDNPEIINQEYEFIPGSRFTILEYVALSENYDLVPFLVKECNADYNDAIKRLRQKDFDDRAQKIKDILIKEKIIARDKNSSGATQPVSEK